MDIVPPRHLNPRLHRFDLCLPDEGLQRVTLLDLFYEHPVQAHSHHFTQVQIVTEGRLSLRLTDSTIWDLGPGDGVVIPAGLPHHPGEAGQRVLMVVLCITSHPANSLERWLDSKNGPWRWRCDPRALQQSVAQLEQLASRPSRPHPARIMQAIWGLFVPEHDEPEVEAPPPRLDDPSIDKRVLHIEAIMRRRLAAPYDARRMANWMQVSVSQMNRLFKINRGMTPLRRLQTLRLEEARLYLANSSMPIKQISDRCGFANPIHFTRLFKQAYGDTPREYRARVERWGKE